MLRFVEVTRPKDLLHLQFEFVNLKAKAITTSAPVLKRIAAGPAFIIVRFPPQHVAEQVRQQGSALQLPFKAFLASPSRVAVRVPDAIPQISLSLEALLYHVTQWDAVPAPDLLDDKPVTVVEFPDRLLIVPEQGTRLSHAATLLTDNGWTELWHTKLVTHARSEGAVPGAEASGARFGFARPNDKKQVFAEFAGNAMDIAIPAAKAGAWQSRPSKA